MEDSQIEFKHNKKMFLNILKKNYNFKHSYLFINKIKFSTSKKSEEINNVIKSFKEKGIYITYEGNDKKYYEKNGNGFDYVRINKIKEIIDKDNLFLKRKTINYNFSSYGLKHKLERYIGEYLSNGEFILAMLLLDYDYKFETLNCCFNISQKSQLIKIDKRYWNRNK